MSEKNRGVATEKVVARFIEGPHGHLFCIFTSSAKPGFNVERNGTPQNLIIDNENAGGVQGRNVVLFVPPFGEEISLCRRFYSLLRNRLSSTGFDCVQPDLYGTGDSAGNSEEATWCMWRRELEYLVEQFCLSKRHNDAENSLSVVSVRAGCLLTQELLASSILKDNAVNLKSVIYIQPELNGYDVVNRLFRARIAAQRFSGNKTQTTSDLWACIERGDVVHAAGHTLGAELCSTLKNTNLQPDAPTGFDHQVMFELEGSIDTEFFASWDRLSIVTSSFWQSYDTEPDAGLIDKVSEALAYPDGCFQVG